MSKEQHIEIDLKLRRGAPTCYSFVRKLRLNKTEERAEN